MKDDKNNRNRTSPERMRLLKTIAESCPTTGWEIGFINMVLKQGYLKGLQDKIADDIISSKWKYLQGSK